MASSMIIFYKLDVVITTIQKISSKTFKTFQMEKTCYRLLKIFEKLKKRPYLRYFLTIAYSYEW